MEEPVNRKPSTPTPHPQLSYTRTHLPPRLKLRTLCDIRRTQSPHNTSSPGERAKHRKRKETRRANRKKVPAYMRCSHARWGPSPMHARTRGCIACTTARKPKQASKQKSPTAAAAFPKGSSSLQGKALACPQRASSEYVRLGSSLAARGWEEESSRSLCLWRGGCY